jgi:hypothetical protein
MLSSQCFPLHFVCCTLSAACFQLHVVCCMLSADCCLRTVSAANVCFLRTRMQELTEWYGMAQAQAQAQAPAAAKREDEVRSPWCTALRSCVPPPSAAPPPLTERNRVCLLLRVVVCIVVGCMSPVTAISLLHAVCCLSSAALCLLHVVPFIVSAGCRLLLVVCCTLSAACCLVDDPCCMVPAARWSLAGCLLPAARSLAFSTDRRRAVLRAMRFALERNGALLHRTLVGRGLLHVVWIARE